jgi:hypothetical protein
MSLNNNNHNSQRPMELGSLTALAFSQFPVGFAASGNDVPISLFFTLVDKRKSQCGQ